MVCKKRKNILTKSFFKPKKMSQINTGVVFFVFTVFLHDTQIKFSGGKDGGGHTRLVQEQQNQRQQDLVLR